MGKLKFLLIVLVISLLTKITSAQPWLSYLPKKETYTLTDFQRAFDRYVKDYRETHPDLLKAKKEFDESSIPGYFQFKRWEWYWKPRVNPITKEFPSISTFDIISQLKASGIKSVGGTWQSLGPSNIDLPDRGTGRINCAAFDPNNDLHFWIGAPSGGVWETKDGGQTWTCLTDGNAILGVSDIALPPDYDANTNPVIFIATGDRDALDDPSIGILKTTDGGQTWQKTGLTFQAKEQVKVSRIIIDPNDKNKIWAATSVGIYKSTDGGNTWVAKQNGNFIDMELIPGSTNGGNPAHLVATTYGQSPKAYLSTDDGETWTATFNGTSSEYRCDVAVAPTNPNRVYIITGNGADMGLYGIYRSDDGGQTWTMVWNGQQNGHNLFSWDTKGTVSDGGQAFYDIALAVSNTDANVLYVGGVNSWISTDGGNTFNPVTCWTSDPYFNTVNAPVIHADHHNAYFRPSDNRLFDVNDGGINYSDDPTAGSNSHWTNITAGLVNGQIYGIGVANTAAGEVIAGFQDNGTKLLDAGASLWKDVKGGDGMNCDIDPTNDNYQWGTYTNLQIDYTTDKWASTTSIRNSGGAAWAGPLMADPRNANTIYIGTDRVERYIGTSKTDMTGTSLDNSNYLNALDVYNDGTNLVIWTASPIGVWKSDNTGHNYTQISGLPSDMVTDIAIDPNDYNHVYLCMGGYDNNVVYETTDGGQTWTNISEGLPSVPAGAIAINGQNTNVHEVYVGTDAGIWVKYGNNPWQLFNNGMPYVSITDLEFYYDNSNPSNTKLYASTYGRAVWVSDCYQPPTLDATVSKIIEPQEDYCESTSLQPKFEVTNLGTTNITSFTISYSLDGGASQSQNWTGTLSQGQAVTITFPIITLDYGSHKINVQISNINGGNDDNQDNNTKQQTTNVWDNRLPYTQTFDNFASNIGYIGSTINLEQCWENDETESSLDWSVNQGSTASSNTGPDGDHTSGSGKYLYTEVSGISSATPAYLLTPYFDFSTWQNLTLEFYYYMYGSDCGTLGPVSYSTDGGSTWNNLNVQWQSTGSSSQTISGNQGQAWFKATVDISALDGQSNVIFRIASTSGTSYQGDIAIDDFSINGSPSCSLPSTQASNLAFSTDYNSMTINWTRGDGDAVLVVMREGSNVNTNPNIGTSYNANSTFGSGDQIGTGNYVVYNGTGSSVTVTGLKEGTTYYVAIYEYTSATNCYLLPGATGGATTKVHAPVITGTSPGYIYADLGKTITISGNYFNNVTSVRLGGVNAASYTVVDPNTITATFNAAPYTSGTLEVVNSAGTGTYSIDLRTRNIIPVGTGSDMHTTINDALQGLYAWWQSNAFDTAKVIEIYTGTYNESVNIPAALNPDVNNYLVIRPASGQQPVIDANGYDYGIYNTLNYCEITGFTVQNANIAGIYTEGDYNHINFNRAINTKNGSGIYLRNSIGSTVSNNLVYNNYVDGIKIESSDNTTITNNTTYGNGHKISPQTGVTIDYEDFESQTQVNLWRGTDSWYWIDYSGYPDYYVSPTHSIGSYVDNTIARIKAIDVSGYTNLTISTWGRSDGAMLSSEYLKAEYSFDNSNWTTFLNLSGTQNAYVKGEATNVVPASDSLYIRYVVNVAGQGSQNYWWIADDFKVTGDETTSPGEFGSGLHIIAGSGYQIKNNIFTSKNGGDYPALILENNPAYSSDYNLYYNWGNPTLINDNNTKIADLTSWSGAGANDLSLDPLYVDTTSRDFHIKSTEGSYHSGQWPPLTTTGGTWTNDATSSPALDAGDPSSDYSQEPQSGNRINLGAYGNTPQASKSAITYFVWIGQNDNNWNNTANWQSSTVPGASDNAIIQTGSPNYPVITQSVSVGSITLEDQTKLDVSTGGSLSIAGSLIIGQNATDTAAIILSDGSLSAANVQTNGNSLIDLKGGTISLTSTPAFSSGYVRYSASANQDIYNWQYYNLIIDGSGQKLITGNPTNPTVVENLTINAASLVIPEGKALTVNGKLINKAGFDALVIKSSASGDGSLIQHSPNVQATVERYLTGTQWHYIGPPVKGADISLFNTNNFYTWDATVAWQGPADQTPWTNYQQDTLLSAIGYAYYYYPTTIIYKDTLNTGTYTITLHKTASSQLDYEGWNLISNPYPAALDIDKLVTQSAFQNGDIEMAFYFYDDASKTGAQDNYRYYVASGGTATGVGTNNANNIIPMGQGLFVKAYTDNIKLTIDPAYCVHANQAFYKKSNTSVDKNILRITISNNIAQDEMVYRFVKNATPDFDRKFDAIKKFNNDNGLRIYLLTPDKQIPMSITSDDPLTSYTDIFLGYNSDQDTLTISLKSANFDNNVDILLEDLQQDTLINLKNSNYTFFTSAGRHDDRFILHLLINHAPIVESKKIYGLVGQYLTFDKPQMYDPDPYDSITMTLYSFMPEWLHYNDSLGQYYGTPEKEGDYSFTINASDSYGKWSKGKVEIHIVKTNDTPRVTGFIPDIFVYQDELYKYDASSVFEDPDGNDMLYTLTMTDGSPKPNFITLKQYPLTIIISPTKQDIGVYNLSLTAQDPYGARTSISFYVTVKEKMATDVDQNISTNAQGFKIYPNPAQDYILIEDNGQQKISNITLTDASGRRMDVPIHRQGNKAQIDIRNIASGVYIISIMTNDQTIIRHKVIKQ